MTKTDTWIKELDSENYSLFPEQKRRVVDFILSQKAVWQVSARKEENRRIRQWAKKTIPIHYVITDLDCEPPQKRAMEAVDKKSLLRILGYEKV